MKTVLFWLLISPTLLWAQRIQIRPEDTQRKQSYLIMRDGTVVRGKIIRQDSSLITVQQRGDVMTFIESDQVNRITADRPPKMVSSGGASYTTFFFRDSSRIEGTFVRRDSTMITVRKRNGQLTYFEPELLLRTETLSAEVNADTGRVFTNRFSPWLLSGLTAYNPEKGRFYYRNTLLLLNEFDYGITRFWSVGASFVAPVPYLISQDNYLGTGLYSDFSPLLFTKLSAPLGRFIRLAVNARYQADDAKIYPTRKGILTLHGLATFGSSQHNVTLGYGMAVPGKERVIGYAYPQPLQSSYYPYITERLPTQKFLTLGIMQNVSPGLTIISDNRVNLGASYHYYNRERVTASLAVRIDRRRHAFDMGVFGLFYERPYLYENKAVRFFPYVGYNLLIGAN
ncbi:hypothetical protein [Spirosoma sp. KUDC1026]|uniref:hypothetical protein n=1 Tax=Spirosoma sp. KUDC1026 TaxID=2745947 RepID=UPI00159B9226|nr:hypothetical protein [Spirosoma sp. KUDC1026]QKZ14278.1 hypothetical protein HU175_17250 [Spirosoma sp. KUDC1026]